MAKETVTLGKADVGTLKAEVSRFKVIKKVTKGLIKLKEGEPQYLKIVGPMHLGKKTTGTGDNARMEPATLLDVVNLATGETDVQIIVPTVLKSILETDYPEDTFVGKCFMITKLGKRAEKRYSEFEVAEIEEPKAA